MELNTFNPVKYSLEENKFLLDHLGEPSQVALKSIQAQPLPNPPRDRNTGRVIDKNPVWYPDGVIPAAVKPILDRVYELGMLQEKFGQGWIGVEAIKRQIGIYLEQQAKWIADKARFRGAPRFPTMHSYDAKGKPHKGGTGSDSGRVSTYFDSTGERHEFTIDLLTAREAGGWKPDWIAAEAPPTEAPKLNVTEAVKKVLDDPTANRLECPVCRHTESYKPNVRSSYNAARGRMSKHLRTVKSEESLHRELFTNEFGS